MKQLSHATRAIWINSPSDHEKVYLDNNLEMFENFQVSLIGLLVPNNPQNHLLIERLSKTWWAPWKLAVLQKFYKQKLYLKQCHVMISQTLILRFPVSQRKLICLKNWYTSNL